MQAVATQPPRWSALLYLAGANDLSPSMARTIDELKDADLPANVDVFVQSYSAEGDPVRYRLARDAQGHTVQSELERVPGNSGDPQSLSNFVGYANAAAPGNHTFLIAGGHGEGHRGVAIDDPHKDRLELPELQTALSKNPVDAVLFDACLMGSLEVAHTLAGEADVMIASEDVVRTGTSLSGYLLAAAGSENAEQLGQRLVQGRELGFSSLTAVRPSALAKVEEPLRQFSSELLKLDVDSVRKLHDASRRGLEAGGNVLFGYYTYPGARLDMGDFCRHIVANPQLDEELRKAAQHLGEVLTSATIAHSVKKESDTATGLTLNLPLYREQEQASLEQVELWKASGWDKVIASFQVQDPEKCKPPSFSQLLSQGL